MGGNTFGTLFRITTFGESHGPAVGVTIDGCPAGIPLRAWDIQRELDRRRPGSHAKSSDGTDLDPKLNPASTSRKEADECEILSGVFENETTGTALTILVRNTNQQSSDYSNIASAFRPGHADYPYLMKYGRRDHRGGGRASARETVGRVAAGAVAKKLLAARGISIIAWTSEACGVSCSSFDESYIEESPMRAPDREASQRMVERVIELKSKGDTAGGVITCSVRGEIPPGLGEPVFDKLDACLAYAILSLGAVKGIEFGAGFQSARMTGSEWNDPMRKGASVERPAFLSNHAGGILGGMSSGAEILFRAAIKPIPSIALPQRTIDKDGGERTIEISGRHDVCACPRIVPVIEAMTAITLADLILRDRAARA